MYVHMYYIMFVLCVQVFTQLIKQTAGVSKEDMDSPSVLSYWQRAIKRYLIMHIKK